MNSFIDLKDQLQKKLNEKNAFTDVLGKIEDKTKVPKIYQVLAIAAIVALYLMVGYGATFLANLIGFLYPAYYSIKAIESPAKDDDTKWLTYWVVYAFFSLIEFFTDIILFWIPLYAFMKCMFLVFLMVPGPLNGSCMLYNNVIQPIVSKYEKRIDDCMDEAGDFAKKATKRAKDAMIDSALKSD
uniref:Receptor expression-enhancing protein n=1 Tax=Schistocephalus solidus TaxID=70667 RepID=A0A0X3PP64_SCHSO